MESTVDLRPLLKPRSIAVIGASQEPARIGRIIFEMLLRADRPVYPVHPTAKSVLGRPAFSSVDQLPTDIDLAVVAVSAERAVEATWACGRKGIPFVIPVAGGFSEVGPVGKALEAELLQVRQEYGTRILGPNTLGIFLPHERLDTVFVEHGDKALASGGGVAFVTQSGSVGTEALGVASNIGFGLRAFVGLGNKVDLDETDFARYFASDPKTTCLAFYVESLSHGREFLQVAKDVAGRKPVVLLKAGRTATGAAAVSSHTGRLAGSDRVISGALRQHGVLRVFDEEQLCDAARTLSWSPPTKGPRVAIVSPGGGYGVIAADYVEAPHPLGELAIARLRNETKERIRRCAPPYASVENPVDLTASVDNDLICSALEAVLADDNVDMVLCFAFFAPVGVSDALVHRISALRWETDKPLVAVVQYGPFTDGLLRRFFEAGVVAFPTTARAVNVLRLLYQRSQLRRALGASSPT